MQVVHFDRLMKPCPPNVRNEDKEDTRRDIAVRPADIPSVMPAQPMLEPGGVVPDHEPAPIPLGMPGPEAPKHRYPSRARRPTDFYGEYITH